MHADSVIRRAVAEIRRFNRKYLVDMELLQPDYLCSGYRLTEVRVLYEIYSRERCSQADIALSLQLDKGYISRLVAGLCKKGLIVKRSNSADKRASVLSLSVAGKAETERLTALTDASVQNRLSSLTEDDLRRLTLALREAIEILDICGR